MRVRCAIVVFNGLSILFFLFLYTGLSEHVNSIGVGAVRRVIVLFDFLKDFDRFSLYFFMWLVSAEWFTKGTAGGGDRMEDADELIDQKGEENSCKHVGYRTVLLVGRCIELFLVENFAVLANTDAGQ